MMKKSQQLWIVIVLLAGIGLAAWGSYFRTYFAKDTVSIHIFPKKIGDWVSEDLPITDEEYAILETRNAFIRKYTNTKTGDVVYLYIVYAQNNRKVSHPPEICYTGGGADVLADRKEKIPLPNGTTIVANNLKLAFRDAEQLSFYWFKAGKDTYTPNYWHQQILLAKNTLLQKSSSSALIRVSSDIINGNEDAAKKRIKTFIRLIAPLLPKYLP